MIIKDNILKIEKIDWRKIKPLQSGNFKNPVDMDSLKASIKNEGFLVPFVVWEDSKGQIYSIDGFHRKLALEQLSTQEEFDVPELLDSVFVVAKTKKEAAIKLLALQPKAAKITELGLKEFVSQYEILELDIQDYKIEIEVVPLEITNLGTGNESDASTSPEASVEKEDPNANDFFTPDCIYPANNIYDIPTLRLDLQGDYPELPVKPYGADGRQGGGVGTYHFYVDDYRFEAIWKNPVNILKSGCTSIVEPNLSLFDTTPISYGLFLIYKKRWISRFFQEKGIKVFADLNVSRKFYEYNQMGIPDGYNSFFTRGYSGRLNYLQEEYEIAKKISGVANPNLVVYGGGKEIKEFCANCNITHIQDFIQLQDIKKH